MTIQVKDIMSALHDRKARSAWDRGVILYAYELLEQVAEEAAYQHKPVALTDTIMLNGAQSWAAYSWGGCSLIYDGDIAERLCTPSELRRCHNGAWRPNSREEWLDTQARALCQAASLLRNIAQEVTHFKRYDEIQIAA